MGFLRFILAVSVLIFHSKSILGIKLVGGLIAVQAFFIISGFYMALILSEKYIGKGAYKAFITSRLLRLFPAYWAVIILVILISIAHYFLLGGGFFLQSWIEYWNVTSLFSKIYLAFTNIFIIGQDSVMFMELNPADGLLQFTSDFTKSKPQLHTFLLIPPAWSLSIELFFYMLAPLLVRRNSFFISIIIAISLLLRIFLYSIGLNRDPWSYRFFPTELMFFLAGIISYRIYSKIKERNLDKQKLLYVMVFIYAFTLLFQFLPGDIIKEYLYYAILIISIPFVFIYTKKSRVDRLLGELSYPIYITHYLIILVIERIVFSTFLTKFIHGRESFILNNFLGILTLILATLLSILLIKMIVEPIESYRQSIAKKLRT